MRHGLSLVLVVVTIFLPAKVWAQSLRAGAALIHAEGKLQLNDQVVETLTTPLDLPDSVVLRASQGRAVIALKRGGFLFSIRAHRCVCSVTVCTTSIESTC